MIPPEQNAEFVCQMETVLEVYERPWDWDNPVLCIDEATKQLVQETIKPIVAQSGQVERYDYRYERNGTANLFMVCEPIIGWRQVEVTQQRTAVDYAHLLKAIVDEYYDDTARITLVQDQRLD